jgi:retron-type reverse transcriptase
MKRLGNLYDKIIDIDNLKLADEKARRGKLKSYGVIKHDKNRDENILKLQRMLIENKYTTSDYHIFKIYEPKEREIYQLPYFPDRIVHHAIMNVLEPIWVKIFIENTYSCIKGRGIHAAVRDLKYALKSDGENTKYCLKLDIRKFYPSIDHDILKSVIRKKIKDKNLLLLLDEIIDSAPGVPIGNYLSQYFANLYLSYFDHWLKEVKHVKYYYRYADDIVILHGNKDYLHCLLVDIKDYLHDNLKLTVKQNYQIFPVSSRGIDFVGYVFYHTHTLMRKSIKKNMCRKAARLKNKNVVLKPYKQALCSWIGWAKYCNSKNLLKTILKKRVL